MAQDKIHQSTANAAKGSLAYWLAEDANDVAAAVNELIDDHATNKTTIDGLVTLANELRTDHATTKTAVDETKTAVDELIDDHATTRTVVGDIKTLVNDIRAKLVGNYMVTSFGAAVHSDDKPHLDNAEFRYMVAGKQYTKAVVTGGTSPGTDVIPQNKYGAVAFDIGTDGTIDIVVAPANAAGYDSAALAKAALPAVGAGHVRAVTITAMDTDGAFTFGTSDLDHAGATVAFEDGQTLADALGAAVSTSPPATLTAAKPTAGPATITAGAAAAGPATLTAAKVDTIYLIEKGAEP